jgi:hypothetical protein
METWEMIKTPAQDRFVLSADLRMDRGCLQPKKAANKRNQELVPAQLKAAR